MKPGYLLLPPSEGKAVGGRGSWSPHGGRFGEILGDARVEIAERLHKYVHASTADELTKFFGVGGAHLERAVESADQLPNAKVLRASERYNGVVSQHLDARSMTSNDQRWIASHLVFVSGLMGVVTAADPVPDYRLKMSARLPEIGVLARWWRAKITAALADLGNRATFVDLLPSEHRAAFDVTHLQRRWSRVEFTNATGVHAAGHAAKAAKGLLARRIVQRRHLEIGKACDGFACDGFAFNSYVASTKVAIPGEIVIGAV